MGQEIRTDFPEEHTCTECGHKFNCRTCHLPPNLVNKFENCLKITNPFHGENYAHFQHVDSSKPTLHFCKEECLVEFYQYMMMVKIVIDIFNGVDEALNDKNNEKVEDLIPVLPWAHQ